MNKSNRFTCVNILLFILLLSTLTEACWGQSPSTGSASNSEDSVRSPDNRQEMPSFLDLMESLGAFSTSWLRQISGIEDAEEYIWQSNTNPRESLFTFLQGMDQWQYQGSQDTAKINMTLPKGYTYDSKEVLSLKSVFDRLGEIPPIDIPGEVEAREMAIVQFEVFPYGIDHEWVWDALSSPPTQKILLVKNEQGQWVFAAETLQSAPALLEAMWSISPVWEQGSKKNLIVSILYPTLRETPWWSWLILLLSIVLAVFSFRWLRKKLVALSHKVQERSKPMIGSLMRSVGTSLAITIGIIIFILGGSFIEFTPVLAQMHWAAVKVIFLAALTWAFMGCTQLLAALIRNHFIPSSSEYGEMAVAIIQRIIHAFIFTLFAFFILENVMGFNVGALITGLGIVGLALSLAGKETAQNLFGAVSIFINRPFVVGDWVQFQEKIGEIDDVKMQATMIRLLSGEMWVVPNMQFISNPVENLAMRKFLRREMNLTLPYDTTPEKMDKAMRVIDEVLRSEEIVEEGKCDLDERPPQISFSEYGEYYLNVKVYYWYFIGDKGEELQRGSERGWFSYLQHSSLVNRAILKGFQENDLLFAYPTQKIFMEEASRGEV